MATKAEVIEQLNATQDSVKQLKKLCEVLRMRPGTTKDVMKSDIADHLIAQKITLASVVERLPKDPEPLSDNSRRIADTTSKSTDAAKAAEASQKQPVNTDVRSTADPDNRAGGSKAADSRTVTNTSTDTNASTERDPANEDIEAISDSQTQKSRTESEYRTFLGTLNDNEKRVLDNILLLHEETVRRDIESERKQMLDRIDHLERDRNSVSMSQLVEALSKMSTNSQSSSTTVDSHKVSVKDFGIQKFANKSELIITDFFRQYDRATNSLGWSTSKKILLLPAYLEDSPRKFFESMWEANQNTDYDGWKSILVKRYLPADYKLNKQIELSQKTFRPGQDVDTFFDELQVLFDEVNPLMSEDDKIAEITRAFMNIPEYRKLLAVTDAKSVDKMRSVLTKIANIDKTDTPVVQNVTCDNAEVNFMKNNSQSNYRGRSRSRDNRDRNCERSDSSKYRDYRRDRSRSYDRNYRSNRTYARQFRDNLFRDRRDTRDYDRNRDRSRERSRDRDRSRSSDRYPTRRKSNSRERRDAPVTEWRFPRNELDFESYRLRSGKLFCPVCLDYRHTFKQCTKAKPQDLEHVEPKCPRGVLYRVQKEYDDFIRDNYTPDFWESREGKA
ncbi:uncharacterized protein LOC129597016 [Paramacrobiotus metropolitanus]|uniref:uncharacterized protein LOC129597016 n=1 Tax=Paramacrobiotus metropolitanus TaxID=2943436 RepID=UPI0024456D53|nr:uncharacterized protein LOC129597016 [Paramacrobiotus metropolitanus]